MNHMILNVASHSDTTSAIYIVVFGNIVNPYTQLATSIVFVARQIQLSQAATVS